MADEAHTALVQAIFGGWLNAPRLHGCSFAKWAAHTGRISYASFFDPPTEEIVGQLVSHIQVAASAQKVALAIFPNIVTDRQLRDFIDLLGASPGWTVARLHIAGRFAVDMRWASSETRQSSITGFAPFGTMPVTRRAPYVAMALWPCGFDNARRKKPDPFVGVGDMAHDLPDERYSRMNQTTRERVSQTRALHTDGSLFTGMTFCLSDSAPPTLPLISAP